MNFKFGLAAVLLSISFAAAANDNMSALCAQDQVGHISFSQKILPRPNTPSVDEVAVLSWNAHKLADNQFFYDLKRLANDADILMVQEALHTKHWQNVFASHMPFAFSFFKSFCWNDTANGVMTAARYGLIQNIPLKSPGVEPGSFTHKVSGYTQTKIGNQVIHLINTHALNFNVGIAFEEQIDHLVRFMAQLKGPVIWAGDFNTWNPARQNYLNKKTAQLGLGHVVPAKDDRFLKLDHMYVRGFYLVSSEVLQEKSSDHLPLRTVLKLKNPANIN